MKVYRLQSQWEIWFAYMSESQEKQSGYGNRLNKIHSLQTSNDLIYLWTQSPIASLTNFFVFPADRTILVPTYLIDNENQKISAINFFKKGIEPKWEDPKNEKGGRYLFQVNKGQENYQQLYQALVFYLIGEQFQGSQHMNGFRFISSKTNASSNFLFRAQIWMDYNQESIENIVIFKDAFTKFLAQNEIKGLSIMFKNNK